MLSTSENSVFTLRNEVFKAIVGGALDTTLLGRLLPGGIPFSNETELWDYKRQLPSKGETEYSRDMAEVVKDVVAFHNTYGGYLVVGVSNEPRELVGYDSAFDCDELNKHVFQATNRQVRCRYETFDVDRFTVGLLLIPQRVESTPVIFVRDAPAGPKNSRAFQKGKVFYRRDGESVPVENNEELSFLWSSARRSLITTSITFEPLHNLEARDPTLIRFVGRQQYLNKLALWLCDRFATVTLLAGYGGLGKTTIAREFVERLLLAPPDDLVMVLWFTAKKSIYSALSARHLEPQAVHFDDLNSLLFAILRGMCVEDSLIDGESSQEQLMDQVAQELGRCPTLVVVDDVDSLDDEEQKTLFHALHQITTRTIVSGRAPSRALLTARHDLGAPSGIVVRVAGMESDEFAEFVTVTAEAVSFQLPFNRDSKQMRRLRDAAGGSPMFAASILRLMQLGESFDASLNRWKGHDGEAVREFAFGKELDRISDGQARLLYALALLGDASQVELKAVTETSDLAFDRDIEGLRKFHLVTIDSSAPAGGSKVAAPSGVRQMITVLQKRVHAPRRIEKECERLRSAAQKAVRSSGGADSQDVADAVKRTMALWIENRDDDALEVAKFGVDRHKRNGDLWCLYGRALLRAKRPMEADLAFRTARDLQCLKPELIRLWVGAKQQIEDWMGLLEITDTQMDDPELCLARVQALLALALASEQRSSWNSAIEHYRGAAQGGKPQALAGPFLVPLASAGWSAARRYIQLFVGTTGPGERLDVWDAVLTLWRLGYSDAELLRTGISALTEWWSSVELRGRHDSRAAGRADAAIREIASMTSTPIIKRNAQLVTEANASADALRRQVDSYRSTGQ
jgi:hypothetical protein